jgi:hypothetical protein
MDDKLLSQFINSRLNPIRLEEFLKLPRERHSARTGCYPVSKPAASIKIPDESTN